MVNFGCDVGLFVVDSDLIKEREETFGPAKRFFRGLKINFFCLQYKFDPKKTLLALKSLE